MGNLVLLLFIIEMSGILNTGVCFLILRHVIRKKTNQDIVDMLFCN